MQLETYDIIMLLVMLAAIAFGAWKGLAWQLASLGAIFVSYFVAYQLRETVAQRIVEPVLNVPQSWSRLVAMLGLYLCTSLIIWIVFGYIRKVIDRVKLQDFDRHAGAVLGAVKGVILCMIITLFAVGLLSEEQKKHICCSYSGYAMARIIDKIDVAMPAEVKDVLHPYLRKLDSELGHNGAGHRHEDGQPALADEIRDTEAAARKLMEAAREQIDSQRQ